MSETLSVALTGLGANKLRTGLTILGLMIGVGSVIVLIAVGTGSSAAVQAQIDALGANTLTISTTPSIGGLFGRSSSSGLTLQYAYASRKPFQGARRQERRAGRQRLQRDADLWVLDL